MITTAGYGDESFDTEAFALATAVMLVSTLMRTQEILAWKKGVESAIYGAKCTEQTNMADAEHQVCQTSTHTDLPVTMRVDAEGDNNTHIFDTEMQEHAGWQSFCETTTLAQCQILDNG